MNNMLRQWISKVGSDFNLPVKDMSNVDRSSYALMTDDIKKQDWLKGKDRTFHSIVTYRIYVELDEEEVEIVPMVTDPEINVSRR